MANGTRSMRIFAVLIILVVFSMPGLLAGEVQSGPDSTSRKAVDPGIRKCLGQMNEVMATRDIEKIMSIFDDGDDIMLVGSDSGEVFVGREKVKSFFNWAIRMPFVFSFDMNPVWISQNQNTAWAFVDGTMLRTKSDGKVFRVPYRIAAIMVRAGEQWKWKVFSGSIPRGE